MHDFEFWEKPAAKIIGDTAIHSHDPQAQHDAQNISTRLDSTRRPLREWHVRRAKELAQEQQRYSQNPRPYKSLEHVDKVPGETGDRGIKAVRLHSGQRPQGCPGRSPQQLQTPTQHRGRGVISVQVETDIAFAETLQPDTATRHAPHPVHCSGTG